jgi:hypothetical protein
MNKQTYRRQVLRHLDQPLTLIEGASPPNTPEECSEERGRRTTVYSPPLDLSAHVDDQASFFDAACTEPVENLRAYPRSACSGSTLGVSWLESERWRSW